MENSTFIFVYAKDGKIKVLNIDTAIKIREELINNGWVHTKTLDACVYLQYLHNNCEEVDLIDEITSLIKKDV